MITGTEVGGIIAGSAGQTNGTPWMWDEWPIVKPKWISVIPKVNATRCLWGDCKAQGRSGPSRHHFLRSPSWSGAGPYLGDQHRDVLRRRQVVLHVDQTADRGGGAAKQEGRRHQDPTAI